MEISFFLYTSLLIKLQLTQFLYMTISKVQSLPYTLHIYRPHKVIPFGPFPTDIVSIT
jgi:hypothetical protein